MTNFANIQRDRVPERGIHYELLLLRNETGLWMQDDR